MTKKYHIISILALAFMTSTFVFAQDSNNLLQLDLKRTSDNSVDVTLLTSDNYGENVMVKKKSDTKYVILVPKVHSAGYKASNLYGVNDLISNVDVKTVDDTTGGYTKVTLITKKPLDIKTKTQKSTPQTAEQKEYNTLIAQANAVKNNISKREPAPAAPQKTEVTVNKVKSVAKEVKAENVNKPVAQSKNSPKVDEKSTQKQIEKQKIDLKGITPDKIVKPIQAVNPIKTAKQEKSLEELALALPVENKEAVATNEAVTNEPAVSNVQEVENVVQQEQQQTKSQKSHKLPKALGIGAIILIMMSTLSRLFRNKNLQNIQDTNTQIYDDANVKQNDTIVEQEQISDKQTHDSKLSWREKYNLYLDKAAAPVKRINKKGSYSFIKTPAKATSEKVQDKAIEKENIEKKRKALEKMITLPKVDFNKIEPEIVEVQSEDTRIAHTVKFKAFENNHQTSLKMTNRQVSRFRGYENDRPLHEVPTIELEESVLNLNKRNLKDANLKVSDVDKSRITYEPKQYIMSSVDEYLSILDDEQSISKMKEDLSKSLSEPVSQKEHMTVPVAKSDKTAAGKNIVIKSRYEISPNKGIYMVNKNGRNALVGKVNNKTFVLKRFDGAVTDTINVRPDNNNVYMVKAGRYKSLVEVNDDKMGVLIEL